MTKPHEIQVEIQASLSTHRNGCMPQEVPEALGYSYVVHPAWTGVQQQLCWIWWPNFTAELALGKLSVLASSAFPQMQHWLHTGVLTLTRHSGQTDRQTDRHTVDSPAALTFQQRTAVRDGNMDLCGKNKGPVVPVDATKAHRRRRGLAPFILNLCTGWGERLNLG
jgi:hypothetical protein